MLKDEEMSQCELKYSVFFLNNTHNQTLSKGIRQAMHTPNFLKCLDYGPNHREIVVLFPARTGD